MTELHNDHAQIANNEGAYIPMEDVDAALRRIGLVISNSWSYLTPGTTLWEVRRVIAEERERLGLPKEVKA